MTEDVITLDAAPEDLELGPLEVVCPACHLAKHRSGFEARMCADCIAEPEVLFAAFVQRYATGIA